MDNKQKSVGQM